MQDFDAGIAEQVPGVDDVVIDLTDAAVAEGRAGVVLQEPGSGADGSEVIDLRDRELAKRALYEHLVSHLPDGELVIDLRDSVLEKLVDLAPSGRRMLRHQFVSGRPPELQTGLHMATIEGGSEWEAAEEFVYDTYIQLGYTDESRDHVVEELIEFRDRSRFHAAVNDDGDIIGTIRTIFGQYGDLPVGHFARVDYSDAEPMCHFSSVVVDPRARSTGVIEHLYRAAWLDGLRHGAATITGLTERWMLEGLRNLYCMPFVPSGIPEWFMGGEVIPITMSTAPAAMEEVARANPEFWLWNSAQLGHDEMIQYGFGHLTRAAIYD